MDYRHVPFITLSEIKPRVWITLSGCNFKCKGCFSPVKDIVGKKMGVNELVSLVKKASLEYYQKLPGEIIITGGESTLNRNYLTCLLSKLNFSADLILETNGYFLDEEFVDELIKTGLNEVMLDLKAYDEELHEWYTGFSNQTILENVRTIHKKINLIVKTVYIPGIIDEVEIENIARFVSDIDPEIEYRINDFKPSKGLSRDPNDLEMENAYSAAKKHLENVIISRSCRREKTTPKKKSWITVFPDGTMKRRSLKSL
ncbi:MAG: pyruvate formate lyase-activating enzyme 1 [Methanobacterium sp. PtaB.Bin024]|nr:MAG: pyruvate formate lyase-activating enzyme 1 [Methanobacterium sp. PtaB.Bin024]